MSGLSLLIKPASSVCNMRCDYCFYRDVAYNRAQPNYGIMSPETTEAMVKNVFSYANGPVAFTFQGGEPTLAGRTYFENFHTLVERYNTKKLPVTFSMQTNGLDLPEELIALLAKHRYLLGVSLDGTDKIHNALRKDTFGGATAEKVNRTLTLMDRYGVDYNILCVITREIAEKGEAVYKYFRSRGFRFLQFIPYVPEFGREEESYPYTLDNAAYAGFLSTVFRLYSRDYLQGNYVSIRQFDNFVRITAGQQPECCGMGGRCFTNLVVESDGSVYPCDFYVLDWWRMGNITRDPIPELLASPAAVSFVKDSLDIHERCRHCEYFSICKGGCRRHRELSDGTIGLNRYCKAYQSFFKRNMPMLMELAQHI